MVTIENYNKIVNDQIINGMTAELQSIVYDFKNGILGTVLEYGDEAYQSVKETVDEHLQIINDYIYNLKPAKTVEMEVTKQDGRSYRIEEIKPVEKLIRTIEPINKQLDVPFNNTTSVHLPSTDKYSLLEQLIIEQRVKNTPNLTNAKIRKMTGCTRFAFNNALVFLQAKNIIPANWVTQNKAGRPIK